MLSAVSAFQKNTQRKVICTCNIVSQLMEEKHVSKKFKGGSGSPILLDEDEDEDLKRAIELSLLEQDPNYKSNTNTSTETKKRKHDEITEVKEDKSSTTTQDWSEPQLFFRLHRIRGIYPKGNVEALPIQQLITSDAKKVILTTYKLELEWLLKACPILLSIPVFISHGEDAEMLQNEYIPDNVKLSTPKTSVMYSVNHGKIMLIEYENKLRVVVSTANLLSVDYDRKTQGLWCQDFPKLDPEKIVAKKIYNNKTGLLDPQNLAWDFQMTLEDYLKHLGVNSVFNLNHYDFSKVRIVLIPTVPGTHKYGNENKYGHLKLKKFLSVNPVDQESFAESNYALQFSSVGALSEKWLFNEFKQSLTVSAHNNTTNQSQENKEEKGKKKTNTSDNEDIQLVWPTVDYVKDSIDGYMAGGSLCFSNKNLKPFLSNHFHVYEPPKERRAIPPHIKCYTRYNKNLNMAWVLLSSANLSKGAMGEQQKDGSQFMIRNFEMGVLFLPSLAKDSEDQVVEYKNDPENTGVHIEDEKEGKKKTINFPFPYKFPPKKYGANDKPWIWDVKYSGPDIFGNNWPIGFM